jgi:mycothiol synthase
VSNAPFSGHSRPWTAEPDRSTRALNPTAESLRPRRGDDPPKEAVALSDDGRRIPIVAGEPGGGNLVETQNTLPVLSCAGASKLISDLTLGRCPHRAELRLTRRLEVPPDSWAGRRSEGTQDTRTTLHAVLAMSTRQQLVPSELEQVIELVERVRRPDGSRALSDHLWIDLQSGGRSGFVAVLIWEAPADADSNAQGRLIGYGQASSAQEARSLELVIDPEHEDSPQLTKYLLHELLQAVSEHGGGPVTWWVTDPEPFHHHLAADEGMRPTQTLLQMHRTLPVDRSADIPTRAFRPGHDDQSWIEVNNRAFAAHGEQGGWDLELLHSRLAEPWFDPAGFLIHERDGQIAGFCWTKIHHELEPPEGEIYVIAVDPAFHGQGLGALLTLAGLDWIARQGVSVAMLYVDADNTSAVALYSGLGFTVRRSDLAFAGTAEPTGALTP